jgi:hypothetical protein
VSFNLDAAWVLLAGFMAGAIGALAALPIALIAVTRERWWRERTPPGLGMAAVGIVAANALLFAWTLLGLILGAVYLGASQPQFSLAVAGALLLALLAAAIVRGRLTWPMWSTTLVAVVAFAGLLPLLAGLARARM